MSNRNGYWWCLFFATLAVCESLAIPKAPLADAGPQVSALITKLSDPDANQRSAAAHALGQVALIFGPDYVIPAIPSLLDAKHDSSSAVQNEAAATLAYIPVGPASIRSYWNTLSASKTSLARQDALAVIETFAKTASDNDFNSTPLDMVLWELWYCADHSGRVPWETCNGDPATQLALAEVALVIHTRKKQIVPEYVSTLIAAHTFPAGPLDPFTWRAWVSPRVALLNDLKPFGPKVLLDTILAEPDTRRGFLNLDLGAWKDMSNLDSLPAATDVQRSQWRADIVDRALKLIRGCLDTSDHNWDDGNYCVSRYSALNWATGMGHDALPLKADVQAIANEPNYAHGRAMHCGQEAAAKALAAMGN